MDQVTLKNFRCFGETQTARLTPLTLLVGENSTGKTSFMTMVRALWDIAYRHRVPDFKEEPYDLGSFDEIVHFRGGRGGRASEFEAGFDFFTKGGKSKRTSCRFEVTFQKRGTVPVPVKRRLSDSNRKVWLQLCLKDDEKWELTFGTPRGSWKSNEGVDLGFQFHGVDENQMVPLFLFTSGFLNNVQGSGKSRRGKSELIPLEGSVQPDNHDVESIEQICGYETRQLHQPAYASAPVRSKPRRTYDPTRPSRDPEGDYIPMYLANIHGHEEQWEALKNALERFGDAAGLFNELSVTRLARTASGPFQIQLRRYDQKAKGPRRNLIDVGYGVSQVLPVITELLREDVAPLVLLQQPEVHLHPSAQAALGTLFCELARRNRQLIVETHSDHLLDRVRMDVRDRSTKLKPDDVSILYFERGELDARIHSLRLDEEGNVLDAPESYRRFFLQETRRSLGL